MVGYAEFGRSGPLYGIMAHLDVVPEGRVGEWTNPPYRGDVDEEFVYGRGAADDKGPAMSALYAMRALRDSNMALNARFRLILGLDEETASRCMKRYNKTEEQPSFSFSPDADFPVVNAEKGMLRMELKREIDAKLAGGKPKLRSLSGGTRINVVPDEATAVLAGVTPDALDAIRKIFSTLDSCKIEESGDVVTMTVKGLAAHAMEPWKGKNAIQMLLGCLAEVDFDPIDLHETVVKLSSYLKNDVKGENMGIAEEDDISGPLTCNVAIVALDGDALSVKCDIRYPVTADYERVHERLRRTSDLIGTELVVLSHEAPLYVPADLPPVRKLLDAYEAITGEKGEVLSTGGGTYCRSMPNAVSFGACFPGEPEFAHQANERLSLVSLRKMTHIFAEALMRLNG